MSDGRMGRRDFLGTVAALGGVMVVRQETLVNSAKAAAVTGDNIISASASELAAAIRSKEVSSKIVVDAYLDRIAKAALVLCL
jgi:amidase